MEHPDPYGHQLSILASDICASDWYFIDYMSIYQYERNAKQEQCFQLAMKNMHVLYAHDFTATFRIEELTPPEIKERKRSRKVTIYHERTRLVEQVPVTELQACLVLYTQRGWCQAEVQWSLTRSLPACWLLPHPRGLAYIGRAPMAPETFKQRVDVKEFRFTHRSDLEDVVRLQKEVFLEKAAKVLELVLTKLPESEFSVLADALPYYTRLDHLVIKDSKMGLDGAKAFAQAVQTNLVLKRVSLEYVSIADGGILQLAEVLKNTTVLEWCSFEGITMGDLDRAALQEVEKMNRALQVMY